MPGIDIYDIDRLLATPEPLWLISDFLRHEEVGVIYGPPNAGKSFLALDWALHVAAGEPWREHAVEQAPVVYFAGEGAFSLQRRIRAWLEYHQLAAPPVYFQTRPLDLRDADVIEQAREALANYMAPTSEHEPGLRPKLLIIDTLSQFFGGGEENGPDMAQFVSHCRYLAQEETCAVLIVHHTNKGGFQERGHTALRGNSDVMYSVKGEEVNSQLQAIIVLNDKNRDNPKVQPLRFEVLPILNSLVVSKGNTEPVPLGLWNSLTQNARKFLYVGGTVENTAKEYIEHEDWMTAFSGSRATFYRYHAKLLQLKAVKPAGNGRSKFTIEGRRCWFQSQREIEK